MDQIEAFGGKTQEKKLTGQMKREFKLIKKSREYSICSITDPAMKFSVQVLACNIMHKCLADKFSNALISFVAQCAKEVQYNSPQYLCKELLENCREA